jgi:hypothetical protein
MQVKPLLEAKEPSRSSPKRQASPEWPQVFDIVATGHLRTKAGRLAESDLRTASDVQGAESFEHEHIIE